MKGFDTSNTPLVGSKWKWEAGTEIVVVSISGDSVIGDNLTTGEKGGWKGNLASFRNGRYTLLEMPGDCMKGFDSNNRPLVGSKWHYTPSDYHLEVVEVVENVVRCVHTEGPTKGRNWNGTLQVFQKENKYELISVPRGDQVEKAKAEVPRAGVGPDKLPLIGSQWKSTVNGADDLFEVTGFVGTMAKLNLLQRNGQNYTGKESHTWAATEVAQYWVFVGMAGEPEKVGTVTIPKLTKKERFDPHTYEKQMQSAEKAGQLEKAKIYALQARAANVTDAALLLEEKAYDERRMIHESDLNACSAPDRKCWEIRGLKPFVQYAPQMKGWFWYA